MSPQFQDMVQKAKGWMIIIAVLALIGFISAPERMMREIKDSLPSWQMPRASVGEIYTDIKETYEANKPLNEAIKKGRVEVVERAVAVGVEIPKRSWIDSVIGSDADYEKKIRVSAVAHSKKLGVPYNDLDDAHHLITRLELVKLGLPVSAKEGIYQMSARKRAALKALEATQ